MAYLTILFALIAVFGGGLSWEANKALPGDLLYPFKISVNEQIERSFARTDAAVAQWDLSLLKEQLDEAQQLAQQGRLDAKAQTDVTQNINVQVKDLTAIADTFQTKGKYQDAADMMSSLYTLLKQETQAVEQASAGGSSNMQLSLAPVLVKLRTTLNTVALISTKVEALASGIGASPASSSDITATAASGAYRTKN